MISIFDEEVTQMLSFRKSSHIFSNLFDFWKAARSASFFLCKHSNETFTIFAVGNACLRRLNLLPILNFWVYHYLFVHGVAFTSKTDHLSFHSVCSKMFSFLLHVTIVRWFWRRQKFQGCVHLLSKLVACVTNLESLFTSLYEFAFISVETDAFFELPIPEIFVSLTTSRCGMIFFKAVFFVINSDFVKFLSRPEISLDSSKPRKILGTDWLTTNEVMLANATIFCFYNDVFFISSILRNNLFIQRLNNNADEGHSDSFFNFYLFWLL